MSIIMENVGKKRARPRRSFTAQFKAEIVELCQRGDRTVRQVSQDFDLTEAAVREWVKQAELDAGTRSDGLNSDEKAELAQLRRGNRRLREEVDIVKRATTATITATIARLSGAGSSRAGATTWTTAMARNMAIGRPRAYQRA